MFHEKLAELEQRLLENERELKDLRQRLEVAEGRRALPNFRRGTLAGAALAVVVLATGLLVAARTDAQAPEDSGAAAPITVPAPFKVVDKAGKTIMSVEDSSDYRGVSTYNKGGQRSTVTGTNTIGNGVLVAWSSSRSSETAVGGRIGGLTVFGGDDKKKQCEISQQGMKVYDGAENALIRVGCDPKSTYGVAIVGKGGKALAAITAEHDTGAVFINDQSDKTVADMSENGVAIYTNGNAVGKLGYSDGGEGFFAVCNSSGRGRLEGGILPDGRGILRAYPFKPHTGDILVGQNMVIGAKAK